MLSGAFGIAFNILLVIFKMIAGAVSGSIAVISDALNNLSDVASALVTLIFFKLSGAEADEEHPFGHGRLEYIAGLIVSLFILIMAFELAHNSLEKIMNPESIESSPLVIVILVVSMLIKFIMYGSYLQASKRINSATIRSTAMDSLSDVLSTGIVLLSLVVYAFTGRNIDGFAGIIVAIFIAKTGIEAAKDTINPLLGEPPSKAFIKDVKDTVLAHEGVLGVHDIVVHNYGPSRIMMSLHVEVPADETLMDVHETVDDIEKELRQKYHCTAVIHMDPRDINDMEAERIGKWLNENFEEIDPALKYHDLRVIRKEGKVPKIELDLEVPYKFRMKDEELLELVKGRLHEISPEYDLDITFDKGEKGMEE
jgi:cation diffusion facilitator family transporter